MPDNLPKTPNQGAFNPPTPTDLSGQKPQGVPPAVNPKPPFVSFQNPVSAPNPTPINPPFNPPLKPVVPQETPGLPLQKVDDGGSQRAKIIGAVLGLLLLVIGLPVALYLSKNQVNIWPRAEDVYPSVSPSPSIPPSCAVSKDYSGASQENYDCKKGSSASVKLKACLPAGCPATDVSYSKTEAYCDGEDWLHCDDACGANPEDGSVHVNGGECEEVSVSCSPHDNCGTCQVDIDGYGVRRWTDSGCGGEEIDATCDSCKIYDADWKEISDPDSIKVGQKIYFSTKGSTNHAEGITKAKFRVKLDDKVETDWKEKTDKKDDKGFYYEYTISKAGSYKIESMVYNSALGWK